MTRLETTQIHSEDDARHFFDAAALDYRDQHGDPDRLLQDRLSLIRSLIGEREGRTLLEIGCGTGMHLFALATEFARVIGIDFSPRMIEQAQAIRAGYRNAQNIALAVDRAEQLATVDDHTIDVVLCVGAFEHMIGKIAVLTQIRRVLKTEGLFVCLTPNGSYLWYRIAAFFGLDTRHLSTDHFVTLPWIGNALPAVGLDLLDSGYWTFVPKGDIGTLLFVLLAVIDWVGRTLGLPSCRGGVYFKAGRRGSG